MINIFVSQLILFLIFTITESTSLGILKKMMDVNESFPMEWNEMKWLDQKMTLKVKFLKDIL